MKKPTDTLDIFIELSYKIVTFLNTYWINCSFTYFTNLETNY